MLKRILPYIPPAVLLLFIFCFGADVPFADDIINASLLERYQTGTLTAADLCKPYNSHIMPVSKIIISGQYELQHIFKKIIL